ncbi:MAG: S8 family serine peptidase [Saprospiraceae bacterium]|nr:S8 family serine peptidase [Lewinellaceae bacterium]
MKIRFAVDTYIRNIPTTKGNQPLGAIHSGSVIEVESLPARGEALENNDRWYRDKNGWYYWSGRTEIVEETPPTPGETQGGIMVSPAKPPAGIEASQTEGQTGIPVVNPPLANDDAQWPEGEIPEGETRLVPSLAQLLSQERQARSAAVPPAEILESFNVQAEPAPDVKPARNRQAPKPPVPPDTAPLAPKASDQAPAHPVQTWQNPDLRKLNWGVQNYQISRDWWQQRGITGRNVTIAILSTGAPAQHPDLVNRQGNFEFPNDGQTMEDRHGLGTQAAVIAAGSGNAVFGVAPEARLLIAKLGEQDHLITPDAFLSGLQWAIEAGADIIAMLLDYPDLRVEHLDRLQRLVHEAIQRNILLVAPVGTSENKKPESRYPARLTGVLSVGAHDQYRHRCRFSARSYDLDLLAPGEGLLTTGPGQRPTGNLKSTGIAAAFTAGFLALIRQWEVEHGVLSTPDAVFDLLKNTAVSRRSFDKGEDVEYGRGTLNPLEILNQIER